MLEKEDIIRIASNSSKTFIKINDKEYMTKQIDNSIWYRNEYSVHTIYKEGQTKHHIIDQEHHYLLKHGLQVKHFYWTHKLLI